MYVNACGGMDALVFDGGGFIYQNGRKVFEAKRWVRCMGWNAVVDLDRTRLSRTHNTTFRLDAEAYRASGQPLSTIVKSDQKTTGGHASFRCPSPGNKSFFIPSNVSEKTARAAYLDDLIAAMIMGLTGYFEKTGAFKSLLIALSGGRDSALTLLLAYLYAESKFLNTPADISGFIRCVSMPTRYNSETTKSIARDLCVELGVTFEERPIEEAFERELAELRTQLGGKDPDPISVQNIMPRIRMTRMQNLANATGAMLIHCGNMTEKALGYGTVGGDFTAGAYSLLGNLPKSVVRELIGYLYETKFTHIAALKALIESEESAELADNQRDEDDLGPIVVLDACVALFYGERYMPDEVYSFVRDMWTDEELLSLYPGYEAGMLKKWVKRFVRMSYRATFKWVVAPLAVHLGSLDLDRERALQIPVVKSEEWLEAALLRIDELPN